jgi:hypothetical protein
VSVFYRQRPGWHFPRAVRAEGAAIWDAEGHRLIDAAGGALVVTVGHGVSEIAEAMAAQARRLITPAEVDEAVAILGDAISAVTRAR